jgi:hypothetical protein
MRKVEARMIQAVRHLANWPTFEGRYLKCDNTEVWQECEGVFQTPGFTRTIKVKLHKHTIAEFYPATDRFCLDDCGWQTVTTKSRLNTLLNAFSAGSGISQHKWTWYCDGAEWPGSKTFPVKLSADNYTLRLAEKVAG